MPNDRTGATVDVLALQMKAAQTQEKARGLSIALSMVLALSGEDNNIILLALCMLIGQGIKDSEISPEKGREALQVAARNIERFYAKAGR